jgi:hypothetical protein
MAGNAPSNAELAQQIAALTAVVTNLANAMANQAPAPAVAPPAAVVSFATSPSVAAIEDLIDYTTKHGASLYEQGTKALGTPFNMKSSQVVIFEKELQDRASMMGWDQGAQNILRFTNKDGRQISLIAEYGQIDAETLKTACNEFMTGVNSDKRAAQNNEQMWRCLYSSLTEEAKATLLTYKKDYEVMVNGQPKIVAPLMYKTMMRLATLDGNATVTALRTNLRELTQYAIKHNGNIDEIHTYFNQNFAQLKARGQSVDDVHTILFEAYLQGVPDATFHDYMSRLQDDWMDQTGDMKDATHEDIMKKAKAKYDLLVNSGKWGAKSPDQEKIIALEARLKQLQDLTLSKQLLAKLKQGQRGQGGQNQNQNQNQPKQGNQQQSSGKQRNQKDRSNKRFQKKDEEWKKTPPKDNEPTQKQVGKKTFHWCIHHMKWTLHKPEDCELGKQQAGQGNQQQQQQANRQQNTANQATYANLLAQLALQAAEAAEE